MKNKLQKYSGESSKFINGILGSLSVLSTRDGGEEQMKKYILGLDTSCYTTSMALVDMNGRQTTDSSLDVEGRKRPSAVKSVASIFTAFLP